MFMKILVFNTKIKKYNKILLNMYKKRQKVYLSKINYFLRSQQLLLSKVGFRSQRISQVFAEQLFVSTSNKIQSGNSYM